MKTRKASRKVKKLVSFHGGYEFVAVLLSCSSRWVRCIEQGENPGNLRYAIICKEYEKVKRPRGEM